MEAARGRRGVRLAARFVGEFAVITLGVLAALAAEEWRQGRADRTLEAEYVSRLVRDLREDSTTWASLRPRVDSKEEALKDVLAWLDDPDFTESGLTHLAAQIIEGTGFAYGGGSQASQSTFDELVSTGRLGLIADVGFRESLLSYYESIALSQTRLRGRETDYGPTSYELVPRDSEFSLAQDIDASDLRDIGERALNADLKSLAIAERNRARFRRQTFLDQLDQVTRLLRSVPDL